MATPRRVNGAERTPASADRSNTVIFTENADIALVIGSKSVTHHFMISRPKLANAAPKLEAALQAIEQDNASAPSLFRLPDDVTDLTAIRVVLQLSHHDFDQLPQAIGFETLFQLAIMADRYELTRLLRPFVRPWLAAFAPAEINTSRHEWVLISWTFGLKALFCAFVDNLINSSHLSVLGDLVTIESMYLPMKASITEHIESLRDQRINALRDMVMKFFPFDNFFLRHSCPHYKFADRNLCILERYGAFVAEAQPLGLLDKSYAPASVYDFLDTIFSLAPQRMLRQLQKRAGFAITKLEVDSRSKNDEVEDDSDYDDHVQCGLEGLREAVAELVNTQRDEAVLLGPLAEHFRDAKSIDKLWGTPLAVGLDSRHSFKEGDLRDEIIIATPQSTLSALTPMKRAATWVPSISLSGTRAKRRRTDVAYFSTATSQDLETSLDRQQCYTDSEYEDDDTGTSEPDLEWWSDEEDDQEDTDVKGEVAEKGAEERDGEGERMQTQDAAEGAE